MKKLLILDSNSILNRAFYGIRHLSAKDGTPTNAIYGLLNILLKLTEEQKPDYLCAAFDLSAPTFRHKMYDGYKAQRKPMPDDLKVQMPLAKELFSKMNIKLLELSGYEADDIIGTVSAICEKEGIECLIATGDKDDLQLASDKTKIILTVSRSGDAYRACSHGQKPHISSCGLRIRFVGGNVFDVLPVDKNLFGIFVVRRHFQSASLLRHRGRGVRAHRAWDIHSRDKNSSLQTPCQKGKDYRG